MHTVKKSIKIKHFLDKPRLILRHDTTLSFFILHRNTLPSSYADQTIYTFLAFTSQEHFSLLRHLRLSSPRHLLLRGKVSYLANLAVGLKQEK